MAVAALANVAGCLHSMHYMRFPSHPLTCCSTFANHNKLKRQAMKVIASAMPADEIAGLAQIFKSIDADDSGTITAEELSAALKGSLLKQVGPAHSRLGSGRSRTGSHGVISCMRGVLKAGSVQTGCGACVQEDLEGLLALVDQDSSGCIDYEVRRGLGLGAAD